MSTGGLLIGVVILIATITFIALPLLRPKPGLHVDELLAQKQRERLLVVYERVLTNIRDLDEDYTTGKMPDGDYAYEREVWVQRGIQVLKSLDDLETAHMLTSSAETEVIDKAIDQKIEDAVAAYRARISSS